MFDSENALAYIAATDDEVWPLRRFGDLRWFRELPERSPPYVRWGWRAFGRSCFASFGMRGIGFGFRAGLVWRVASGFGLGFGEFRLPPLFDNCIGRKRDVGGVVLASGSFKFVSGLPGAGLEDVRRRDLTTVTFLTPSQIGC